ncbi:hybrid-cluster NAD(P)-dependent oxidoreductase [Rhodospirillaceae bacterium KN72]|uniref:Hybrid-cluster NAD(P)-dependent oxidoreductase n=1 Tax=Pacificispira spongiicola TaxID=2729598 RepID=A0A7Y0HCN5_9PROT|nr:hybrid-cluster NAD(P)-dependent oxidoreductase [Pacificispira spongiicola]NMM42921.1 hybrid-cluster NAD(P)-dependent oxidoreductase [Pacificispira spongiicola]
MMKLGTYLPLNERAYWKDSQELVCVMIIPEAPDTVTFCFKTADDSWFLYQPGQFISLELPVGPQPILRTYTLSSSPSRPISISVTVKAQADSIGTRWMIDNLKVGDRLRAYGPGGIFTFTKYSADKYLFIGAGSGITPMMSMTRYLFDNGEHTDIALINCARRPSELLFANEMRRMSQRVPDIKLHFVVEEDDPYAAWAGYRGRLNQLMLELMAPDYMEREIFCCGPEPFMRAVRDVLNVAGFDMDHYHEESFHAPIRTEEQVPEYDDVVPSEEATAHLTFALSGVEADCRETDSILTVAREAGLNIPSACQFGVCGTCKVKKTKGEVHMVHNGGITDDEIADGFVLACCSQPIGAVEVEV